MTDDETTDQPEPTGLPARRGAPGATYAYTEPDGSTVELVADAKGLVRPGTASAAAALEVFGLPVAAEPKGGR